MKLANRVHVVAFLFSFLWSALFGQSLFVPGGTVGSTGNGSGNVGIGTANPTKKLTVEGDGLFGDGTRGAWVATDANVGGRAFLVLDKNGSSGVGSGSDYVYLAQEAARGILASAANTPLVLSSSANGGIIISPIGFVGIGTDTPAARLHVSGQIAGGFGAHTTGGVLDWNDVSNSRSGNGYSLLLGTVSNGPGPGVYFHPFNFEYASKDGSGSITQFAIPYGYNGGIDSGLWMRGRYWNDPWGPWVRILSENTSGKVGIGTLTPSHKLTVNGAIRAKEVIVDTGWSDYVFAPDYELAPLSEVEAHIKEHQHLPGIPSAKEVADHGISVGEMQAKLLAKIEELTLHQIQQAKEIAALRVKLADLKAESEAGGEGANAGAH